MTAAHTAIAILLLQQCLFTLLWLMLATFGLARRAAWHWAGATALLGGGMALVLMRDRLDLVWGFWLANLLLMGGFLMLRRGVEVFARQTPSDRTSLAWLLAVPAAVLLAGAERPGWPSVTLLSLAMSWIVGGAAWTVHRGLREEFGRTLACACAVPMATLALVLGTRGVLGPFMPSLISAALTGSQTANVAMLVSFVGVGVLVTLGQVLLVMTRLVTRLRRLSDRDSLTDVYNRRSIERALAAETARLARSGQPFAVLALDIDHFKEVNDRYGHPAGDQVLRELAALMQRAGRSTDLVARTGGEEFWMLMPGADRAGSVQVAERLHALVGDCVVRVPQAEIRFTVSIGVALADDPREDTQSLIRRLDAALYRAKNRGRNRVEQAEPAEA